MCASMAETFLLARLGYKTSSSTKDLIIGDEFQTLEDIHIASELAVDLATKNEEHFKLKYVSTRWGYKIECTPRGHRIKGQISNDWYNIKKKHPNIELNPALKVLTDKLIEEEVNGEHPLSQIKLSSIPTEMAIDVCRRLNSISQYVYQKLNTAEQKAAMANFKRTAMQNFDSCTDQVASLLENHAKLLVIRLDLYASSSLDNLPDKLVELCINKFIEQLRQSRIIPNVLDYICKREFGIKRDIHYHLIIFMDGDIHQQDITFAGILGQKWMDICKKHGQGLVGTYYNCNQHKDQYMRSGIGLVHYADHQKIFGLRKAITYITKPDFFIRYVTDRGTRNLRKGIHPDLKKSTQCGAPRKYSKKEEITRLILTTRDDHQALELVS